MKIKHLPIIQQDPIIQWDLKGSFASQGEFASVSTREGASFPWHPVPIPRFTPSVPQAPFRLC